jgi:hypothetical protein
MAAVGCGLGEILNASLSPSSVQREISLSRPQTNDETNDDAQGTPVLPIGANGQERSPSLNPSISAKRPFIEEPANGVESLCRSVREF